HPGISHSRLQFSTLTMIFWSGHRGRSRDGWASNTGSYCMSEKKQHEDVAQDKEVQSEGLARIDDLEITPLSDEELDSVAGGYTDSTTVASCTCCAAGATVVRVPADGISA